MSAEQPFDWEAYRAAEFANLPRDPYQDPDSRIVDQAEQITLFATLELIEANRLIRFGIATKRVLNNCIDNAGEQLATALVDWDDLNPRQHEAAQDIVSGNIEQPHNAPPLARIRARLWNLPPGLLGNPPRRTRMDNYDRFRLDK